MRKNVKYIHQHADAMERETAVESSMLDDNKVRLGNWGDWRKKG
jgi:hypothetical protein